MLLSPLALILLLHTLLAQNTDFNYTDHGRDWQKGCKSGTKQSPIVLTSTVDPINSSYLFGAYSPVNASINFYNTTTYISGSLGQVFTMTIKGKATPFRASDIRIRCQSQHVIHFERQQNFTRFPLELQIFHVLIEPESTNDKIAIAIHYEIGTTPDPLIQKIIDAEVYKKQEVEIDLSAYIKRGNTHSYWMYVGSPTIPNCIDGSLNWIIIDKRFSITYQQYTYFKNQFYGGGKQMTGNWRDIKTTDGPVGYYQFGSV